MLTHVNLPRFDAVVATPALYGASWLSIEHTKTRQKQAGPISQISSRSQFAGAAAGTALGRKLSAVPSDLVTVSHCPAGRPSRSGCACTVTTSPGTSEFFLMPARISEDALVVSNPHSVSTPLSSDAR